MLRKIKENLKKILELVFERKDRKYLNNGGKQTTLDPIFNI